ncbi:MAG: hypothetical protein ACYTG1_12140 [Planctomycetota bacterium]|jgi:hypothetical protein
MPRRIAWLLSVLAVYPVLASGAEAPPSHPDPGAAAAVLREIDPSIPVTMVYDVRDLARVARDTPPGVETGLVGGAAMPRLRPAPPTVEDVIDRLRRDVAPGTWDRPRAEGETSRLQELNGNLVITTRPAHHDRIVEILGELRRRHAVTVLLEFLFVDEGDDPVPLDADFAARVGADGRTFRAGVVPAARYDELETRMHADEPARLVAAPHLLVQDGRAATITVSSGTAVELPADGDAPEPVLVRPLDGVAVWVRPELADDLSLVTLSLETRRATLEPADHPTHERAASARMVTFLAEGEALALRLPLVTSHLVGARLEDGALAAIDREPCPDDPEPETVLVLVRPRLVTPGPPAE